MSNGDLRLSANQKCWPEQAKMEAALGGALKAEGWTVVRAHPYDKEKKHGFIDSQKMGLEVFRKLDPNAPLIVAESVWQYSQHLLGGLFTHRGPILTVANWSGTWPGLVGMLNLNASMTKAGIRYSSLWSEDFKDKFFTSGLCQWLNAGVATHDQSHVRDFSAVKIPKSDEGIGRRFARTFKQQKAIMGIFDEGCMGMFNAIIPDELLHPTGLFKERLSQSALYAAMQQVSDDEANAVLQWLLKKGMTFHWGKDESTELTRAQTLLQCKMYVAAVRIADEFGCSTIG
ncbi:MAG: fucose isomerase, partial [Limisphaerales bacterium]